MHGSCKAENSGQYRDGATHHLPTLPWPNGLRQRPSKATIEGSNPSGSIIKTMALSIMQIGPFVCLEIVMDKDDKSLEIFYCDCCRGITFDIHKVKVDNHSFDLCFSCYEDGCHSVSIKATDLEYFGWPCSPKYPNIYKDSMPND